MTEHDSPATYHLGAMAVEGGGLELGSERVEAFSDAVMAVIITIMAFQLTVPNGFTFHSVVQRLLPGVLIYVLSFTVIGIYWVNHHHLMRAAERISGAVMWTNLLLLFFLSLVPVLTEWLASSHALPHGTDHGYEHALPAAMYGSLALVSGFAYRALVVTLIRANGTDSALARAIGSDVKGYTSLALYAVAIPLAWVSPNISYGLYVTVALVWFVPDRRFVRA
jgi:uncharacterized membrane protein